MQELKYLIVDELGIHARPAGLLVKTTSKFSSQITIQKGSTKNDAKSIIGVMSIGAKKGDEITITCDGTDETEAIEAVRAFLTENL